LAVARLPRKMAPTATPPVTVPARNRAIAAWARAATIRASVQQLPDLIARLIRLGPELLSEVLREHFPTPADAVSFWRSAWDGLRLEERYAPLVELDTYAVAPEVSGELLRSIVEANGDLRMHISNGAATSFADTLPLLHPHGVLQCHDLFLTAPGSYLTGFHGPGKYDGSVVNWVNGPLLALAGNRRGFEGSGEHDVHAPMSAFGGVEVKSTWVTVMGAFVARPRARASLGRASRRTSPWEPASDRVA